MYMYVYTQYRRSCTSTVSWRRAHLAGHARAGTHGPRVCVFVLCSSCGVEIVFLDLTLKAPSTSGLQLQPSAAPSSPSPVELYNGDER